MFHLFAILSCTELVHIFAAYFCMIHFKSILASIPSFFVMRFSFTLLDKTFYPLSESCWFCLASAAVEKHLVISIGNEVSGTTQIIVLFHYYYCYCCNGVKLCLCDWTTNRSIIYPSNEYGAMME